MAIGLGSNLGDREGMLRRAVGRLGERLVHLRVSRMIDTEPLYVADQPRFLNAVAVGETSLGPRELLGFLKGLEAELGRSPRQRYGPREIDLDLVAYGSLSYRYREAGATVLQVPHPALGERGFVLGPLAELEPEWVLPGLGRVGDLADRLASGQVSACSC